MTIKLYKPTTSARRHTSVINYRELLDKKVKAPRSLMYSKSKSAGRNNRGVITVRHRGGGFKKKVRDIDFVQNKYDIPAKVQTIEYDPGRTSFVSLISYQDGAKRFMLTPDGVKVGDVLITSIKAPIRPGNRLPLSAIPIGTFVHNIELKPGGGGKISRSAGNFAIVQAVEGKYANLKMPSGEQRRALSNCWATIGQVSNTTWNKVRVGKAGRKRLMGWRPTVRGKAMNPVDHPHGGGEGKQPIGMKYPKTKWGKHALGVKTRSKKKYSDYLIIKRRR